MSDGLDSLEAKSTAKRRGAGQARTIPPSRHTPRGTRVGVPGPEPEPTESGLSVAARDEPQAPAIEPEPSKPASAAAQSPADKATLWLTSDHQRFLDGVVAAGRQATPRLALSRSAVSRFALSRLAEEMSQAEIVEALSGPTNQVGPGRKLR